MNRKVLIAGIVIVLPLLGLLLANLGRDPHVVDSPLIGKAAPPFTLAPIEGGPPVSLSDLAGEPVVVNFWATWCVPCFQEHEALQETARAMGSRAHFVGVIYEDEADQVRGYIRQKGMAYPTLMDPEGKTAIAYGVYGVPETYFIDPHGTIVAKFAGPLTRRSLTAYIEMARGGAESAPGAGS